MYDRSDERKPDVFTRNLPGHMQPVDMRVQSRCYAPYNQDATGHKVCPHELTLQLSEETMPETHQSNRKWREAGLVESLGGERMTKSTALGLHPRRAQPPREKHREGFGNKWRIPGLEMLAGVLSLQNASVPSHKQQSMKRKGMHKGTNKWHIKCKTELQPVPQVYA